MPDERNLLRADRVPLLGFQRRPYVQPGEEPPIVLAGEPVTVTLNLGDGTLRERFGTAEIRTLDTGSFEVDIDGYGYQWIRLVGE